MSGKRLYTKISITNKNNYLVVSLETALTDTEFSKLKGLVLRRASRESVRGVVIDLKALDVIDSFATRILHNLALSAVDREVPIIMAGIKPVVAKVMEREGLQLPDKLIHKNANISESIARLEELQHNYR